MVWWGWLIIVAVVLIAALILGYIWGRKSSPDVDRKALADSERKAFEESIEAEKAARVEAEQARNQLATDLKQTRAWYHKNVGAINDDAKKEFDALVSDPDALDRKLDALLGTAEADND